MLSATDKLYLELEEKAKACADSVEALVLYEHICNLSALQPRLNERFHERQVLIVAHLGYIIRGVKCQAD